MAAGGSGLENRQATDSGCLFLVGTLGNFSGRGGIGAAVGILLLLMALTPFAFITAWIAAWRLMPKQLPFFLNPAVRRVIGGIMVLASVVLTIGLWIS